MSLDRADRAGLGVAFAGHLLLFGVLSAGFLASSPPLVLERQPVEVQLVDEVGLESGAPQISEQAPAPKLAEIEGPVEPSPPMPLPPAPQAAPTPAPKKAVPVVQPKPSQQKPAPTKAATRPTGRLKGILRGISDRDSTSRSAAPTAKTLTPAVQSSLRAAVLRQLKPHWKAPTGADAELLRTELEIRLAKNGSVIDIAFLRQSGLTASNRGQAELHKEQAIKAVKLASPFQLPAAYYDSWKLLSPIGFDKRLSQ